MFCAAGCSLRDRVSVTEEKWRNGRKGALHQKQKLRVRPNEQPIADQMLCEMRRNLNGVSFGFVNNCSCYFCPPGPIGNIICNEAALIDLTMT